MPSRDRILQAANLARSVPVDGEIKPIIRPFSFSFERGKIYGLVGPSGAGKSSLLRLFNRLDEKSGGQLYFHGRSIEAFSVTELRRKISLVFQIPHLFPGTVAANLYFCCPDLEKSGGHEVGRYLSMVGLDGSLASRDPEKLSVGQKQRVALARSLVLQPEILLLDEPTSALDPGAARVIEELVTQLNRDLKLTIIMVTHDFDQALRLAEEALLLVDGTLVESGSPRQLLDHAASDLTRRFVRGDLR